MSPEYRQWLAAKKRHPETVALVELPGFGHITYGDDAIAACLVLREHDHRISLQLDREGRREVVTLVIPPRLRSHIGHTLLVRFDWQPVTDVPYPVTNTRSPE